MRKLLLSTLLLSTIFMSCKKDKATTTPGLDATFTFGAWSDCSTSGIQTRTWTVSPAGSSAQPPADSISRSCQFSVIFNYGDWTACDASGMQTRSVVSTIPADSFNVSEPPIDSTERFCNGGENYIIGTWKMVADSTFDIDFANNYAVVAYANVKNDTLYNPTNTRDDLYQFTTDSLFYNESGTINPVITTDYYITLNPSQAWKYSGTSAIQRYNSSTSAWSTWYYISQFLTANNKLELYRYIETVSANVYKFQFTTFKRQ